MKIESIKFINAVSFKCSNCNYNNMSSMDNWCGDCGYINDMSVMNTTMSNIHNPYIPVHPDNIEAPTVYFNQPEDFGCPHCQKINKGTMNSGCSYCGKNVEIDLPQHRIWKGTPASPPPPPPFKEYDSVNKPKHYQLFPDGTQVIDVIKKSLSEEEYKGYLKGNILKYRLRAGRKGDPSECIAKANWYNTELEGD
jgi:hypothetical protein